MATAPLIDPAWEGPIEAAGSLRLVRSSDPDVRSAAKSALSSLGGYAFVAVLSLLILACVMRLWQADLTVPFHNGSDALLTQLWAKTLVDHSWYLHNPDIGSPGHLEFEDYPLVDSWHFLMMKGLARLLRNHVKVVNCYFVLGFPLAAVSALFLLRQLHVSYGSACVVAELFAFLPYHFFRGTCHLLLASYYCIPLAILVGLWISQGHACWPRWRWLAAILIAAITSMAGIYYAIFSCYFLMLAGLAACWSSGHAKHLARAFAVVAIVTCGCLANLLPAVVYQWRHGSNPEACRRFPAEAEMFGLKLVPLLLPILGHRLNALNEMTRWYLHPLAVPLLNNENMIGSLGFVGVGGFFILIGRVLLRRSNASGPTTLDQLAAWNIYAILLATMGGFGMVISLLGFVWIRAYNRISIFIALFAFIAVGLVLDRLLKPGAPSRGARVFRGIVLSLLLVIGVLDQTTEQFVPSYTALADEQRQMDQFVQAIQATVPARTMIFQLPYVPFLESLPPANMQNYDHCRPYLRSTSLRWSYGAMPGRRADAIQRSIAALHPVEMVGQLSLAGFGGIWIDRDGYADRALGLSAELSRVLSVNPLESGNRRWVFLDMATFNRQRKSSLSDSRWKREAEKVLNPILSRWTDGFSFAESAKAETWRCCSAQGRLELNNPLPRPQKCLLTMAIQTWHPQLANFNIQGLGVDQNEKVSSQPRSVSVTCLIPSGVHALTFACDAPRAPDAADPRDRVFVLRNFSLQKLEP